MLKAMLQCCSVPPADKPMTFLSAGCKWMARKKKLSDPSLLGLATSTTAGSTAPAGRSCSADRLTYLQAAPLSIPNAIGHVVKLAQRLNTTCFDWDRIHPGKICNISEMLKHHSSHAAGFRDGWRSCTIQRIGIGIPQTDQASMQALVGGFVAIILAALRLASCETILNNNRLHMHW